MNLNKILSFFYKRDIRETCSKCGGKLEKPRNVTNSSHPFKCLPCRKKRQRELYLLRKDKAQFLSKNDLPFSVNELNNIIENQNNMNNRISFNPYDGKL